MTRGTGHACYPHNSGGDAGWLRRCDVLAGPSTRPQQWRKRAGHFYSARGSSSCCGVPVVCGEQVRLVQAPVDAYLLPDSLLRPCGGQHDQCELRFGMFALALGLFVTLQLTCVGSTCSNGTVHAMQCWAVDQGLPVHAGFCAYWVDVCG